MSPLRSTLVILLFLLLAGVYFGATGQPVHWPGFAFMVVFYGVIFYIGARAGRRGGEDTAEEMMLAGRSLPLWLGVFTMSATWVGGGYINGTAEATAASGLVWVQAPWGYALSLVLGGLFFARKMRRAGYATMLDPLAERYGTRMAAVLYIPALCGELFWTAAILTALGTTFGVILGVDFTSAILLSALVAVAYTALGGLWSVASTDVLQLGILVVGLWLVVPVAAEQSGGLANAWGTYVMEKGQASRLWPPLSWPAVDFWTWWDSALLLIFGGIPWQVYFQRVLASRDEDTAARLSFAAAAVCLVAAAPAVMIGIISATADWGQMGLSGPPDPALTLPYVLRYLTNPVIAALGLGALSAAVMSSVDSSILSASSMAAWNVYRPLVAPETDPARLAGVIRRLVWIVGGLATVIALQVKSVYALWFLCSDFVYCILFPQLVTALFDRQANWKGAAAGLVVSFCLRFGGGEPTLGLPALFDYGAMPFRTVSMLAGLLTIVLVSRLTGGAQVDAEPS